ncbi:hypothetical protein SUGI_0453230 [Cryptomeria japonica]|nr:hypothetical protein SUGI_0453230 [Cryptomeria japonica]
MSCCWWWWKTKPDGTDTAQNLSTDPFVEAPDFRSSTSQEPTPKLEEVLRSFQDVDVATQADVFILAIKRYLEEAAAQKNAQDTPTGSFSNKDKWPNWDSFIQSGSKFLKFVSDGTEKIDSNFKGDFFQSGEATKIIGDALQQIGHLHWAVAGLSIVGYLVSRSHQVSQNRTEYVELLKEMCILVYHIKRLYKFIEEK